MSDERELIAALRAELEAVKADRERLRGFVTNLLWPNVPSADDFALMIQMIGGSQKNRDAAMALVERLRMAQHEAAQATKEEQ